MRKEIIALVTVGLLLISSTLISATYGNGTNGFWTSSDYTMVYKGSVTMKFKAQTDFNFGQFDAFEVTIWDANATAPLDYNFINEHIQKTVTVNTAKTEITVTLKSLTIDYTNAVAKGMEAKNYYLKVDVRKNGDTLLGVDNFLATPTQVRWDLTSYDIEGGDGWKPDSAELDYTKSVTLTYEGYIDQFKNIGDFSQHSLGINGLDSTLKSDYFKTTITKINDRSIRITIDSEAIPTIKLYENVVEAKKYDGYIIFHPDLNIPTKYFKVDMDNLPSYSTGTGTDYQAVISALQAEVTAKNATIATLQAQIDSGTTSSTELSELRGLRNTAVSQLFAYGATNDSTNTALSTYLATAVGEAKNWDVLSGLGYTSGSTLYTDFVSYKAQAQNPSCPTTQCNYSNYVAKSQYDSLNTQNTALVTERDNLQTELANATTKTNMYGIYGFLAGALIFGIGAWVLKKPKNGNRPRPPTPQNPEQKLTPHRHKGGVPPESALRKKKQYIGKD